MFIKKIGLMSLGFIFVSNSAFGNTKKFLETVEITFEKPGFVEIQNNPKSKWRAVNFNNFNYKKFKSLSGKKEQQFYVSNYLKLKDLVIRETKTAAFIIKSREATKEGVLVFKEKVPDGIREQIVVVIRTIPKRIKVRNLDKSLRSLYSKDGDLKPIEGGNKLILTDWVSNQRKMTAVINSL